jgi:type I restriction enzyme S subunit
MTGFPMHWAVAWLKDIVSKLVDGSHNPPPKNSQGLPMLSALNITQNTIEFSSYRLIDPGSFAIEHRRTRVSPGDVLLTIVGAIGRAAVVPQNSPPFTLQRSVAVFSPILIEPKFLMYQLEAPEIAQSLKDKARGTAQKGIYLKTLGQIEIALPPLGEQRRIVAKIEELFSEVDKGIESLTTAREQLKAYRQSILKAAFEGKLTVRNASDGGSFSEKPLGAFLKFLTSGSRGWADYYAENGHTFIRAQNLKYDRLDLSDRAYVQIPEDNTERVRTRVCYGDVLVTITGANVTRTGIINKDLGVAYVSQHVALCRTTDELLPEFLYWYLVSDTGGRKQLNAFAYGAGKPGLNLNNIRQVKIPVPPLQAQKAIVSRISELLDSEQKMSAAIKEAFISAASLRQSILKRAFSGQLVPQVANEEPASVLLDRIRTEKCSSPRKNRSEAHV